MAVYHWIGRAVCILLALVPLAWSPYFFDSYTGTKWAVLYVASLLALICIVISKKLFLPRNPYLLGLLGLIALSSYFTNSLSSSGVIFGETNLQRLTVAALFVFSLSYFKNPQNLRFSIWAQIVALILFLSVSAFKYLTLSQGLPAVEGLMGNENISAQYVGLGSLLIPVGFYSGVKLSRAKLMLITVVALAIGLTFIFGTKCRSMMLAFGLGFWISAVLVIKYSLLSKLVKVVSFVVLLLGCSLSFVALEQLDYIRLGDRTSLDRLDMWSKTLKMANDHPLGIGTDNHLSGLLPRFLPWPKCF